MEKKKIALLSMDVEEWYHLEYFRHLKTDENQSVIKSGIELFTNLLKVNNIKATFFVLGSAFKKHQSQISSLYDSGHEISYHSFNHKRPSTISINDFTEDLKLSEAISRKIGIKKMGYRAPCFSLGRDRLDHLISSNLFIYDSSLIYQSEHPLYEKLDMNGFQKVEDCVYVKDGFYEFEMPTIKFFKFNIPISGGGYIRIIPWPIYKYFLKKYLKKSRVYLFYIHPFELCHDLINLPQGVNCFTKFRFNYNRKKTLSRIQKSINLLREFGYEFLTHRELIDEYSHNRR